MRDRFVGGFVTDRGDWASAFYRCMAPGLTPWPRQAVQLPNIPHTLTLPLSLRVGQRPQRQFLQRSFYPPPSPVANRNTTPGL